MFSPIHFSEQQIRSKQLLQTIKGIRAFLCPFDGSLHVSTLLQWCCHFREILTELTMEIHCPHEMLYPLSIHWFWPFHDCLYLFRIHPDSLSANELPKMRASLRKNLH